MKTTIQRFKSKFQAQRESFGDEISRFESDLFANFCGEITEILEVERCSAILQFHTDCEARIEDSRNFANLEFNLMRTESSQEVF
jgi:hypothetical protein